MIIEIYRISENDCKYMTERYPEVIDVIYIRPFHFNLVFKSGKIKTIKINERDTVHLQFSKWGIINWKLKMIVQEIGPL